MLCVKYYFQHKLFSFQKLPLREAKALEVSPEAIGSLLEGFGVSSVQVPLSSSLFYHHYDHCHGRYDHKNHHLYHHQIKSST